ncbi:hypothetical protein [Natronobacterium gregoryi]|uniref:DUF1508 domain-containing protein n=2 Tax=Natronobacterium gregoryi TaxID=44930 RepID=L0AIY1_NATGS|nr:hypothetical protein [Natronobacterium gregoryi]AFZ73756.1 hypothetical protein Natgr_2604 [Natronobacterium gregoryi SP2]ELY65813.1 hypothetical protein C490_13576 [Natronobacterium gregoryi SP2]PLK19443.1 hypothetical protein CYV19_14860 [Natronobacterium gregoryi SP2]SFJ48473.1 hypothetical protein SAMN05443661_13333 [Natronobacterium gregoryi]
MAQSAIDTANDEQPSRHVLLDRGDEWEWKLIAEDGELTASKAIPYDGVRYYTTKDENFGRQKNSVGRLSVEGVIDHLAGDSDIPRDDIEAAIETVRADDVL